VEAAGSGVDYWRIKLENLNVIENKSCCLLKYSSLEAELDPKLADEPEQTNSRVNKCKFL
jgi:hypothetical protein